MEMAGKTAADIAFRDTNGIKTYCDKRKSEIDVTMKVLTGVVLIGETGSVGSIWPKLSSKPLKLIATGTPSLLLLLPLRIPPAI